jgi:hypothetical protein
MVVSSLISLAIGPDIHEFVILDWSYFGKNVFYMFYITILVLFVLLN